MYTAKLFSIFIYYTLYKGNNKSYGCLCMRISNLHLSVTYNYLQYVGMTWRKIKLSHFYLDELHVLYNTVGLYILSQWESYSENIFKLIQAWKTYKVNAWIRMQLYMMNVIFHDANEEIKDQGWWISCLVIQPVSVFLLSPTKGRVIVRFLWMVVKVILCMWGFVIFWLNGQWIMYRNLFISDFLSSRYSFNL